MKESVSPRPPTPTLVDLAALGHVPRPVLAIVRAKCVDCCNGSRAEVKRCATTDCPLWPLRTGRNPFAVRRITEVERGARGVRATAARASKQRRTSPEPL